jgi:hypothetical protein
MLHPNPAQQAATTLRGDSERTEHSLKLSNSAMSVNWRHMNFPSGL